MTQENKKISFGFSKISKKPLFKSQNKEKETQKEYIKSIDDKSIKLINEVKVNNGPLVIPLLENKSWRDKVIETINNSKSSSSSSLNVSNTASSSSDVSTVVSSKNSSTISSLKNSNSSAASSKISSTSISSSKNSKSTEVSSSKNSSTVAVNNSKISSSSSSLIGEEEIETKIVEEIKKEEIIDIDVEEIKKEEIDEKELERQAVLEIMKEINKEIKIDKPDDFEIKTTEVNESTDVKESTLEDYEQIPIEQFGMAMLRGMGWQPDKGIGKNPKLVTTVVPASRPRGMGLGADKVVKKPSLASDSKDEKMKLERECFVKINAGKFLGHYGVLEGFDENAGRVMVKLSLLDNVESFNEFIVDRVAKEEFDKNSKVINITKYEEYKNKNKDKEDDGRHKTKSRANGHEERRDTSSRDKRDRRDRERSRSKERSRSDKHERRDKERDRSGDRRSRHKKSKHHKKHRH